jgi:hypothetical protein
VVGQRLQLVCGGKKSAHLGFVNQAWRVGPASPGEDEEIRNKDLGMPASIKEQEVPNDDQPSPVFGGA